MVVSKGPEKEGDGLDAAKLLIEGKNALLAETLENDPAMAEVS